MNLVQTTPMGAIEYLASTFDALKSVGLQGDFIPVVLRGQHIFGLDLSRTLSSPEEVFEYSECLGEWHGSRIQIGLGVQINRTQDRILVSPDESGFTCWRHTGPERWSDLLKGACYKDESTIASWQVLAKYLSESLGSWAKSNRDYSVVSQRVFVCEAAS